MAEEGSIVVEAVASMTAHGAISDVAALNARIQAAMVAAIIEAQANGITDPEAVRAAQIAARDRVLSESTIG